MLWYGAPIDIIVDKSILQSKLLDIFLTFRVFDQKVCLKCMFKRFLEKLKL